MKYDVAIVGGGPAGSACALALGTERSIVILDARTPKLCGGLLNREAASALAPLLGRKDVEETLASAGVLREPRRAALELHDWDTGFSMKTQPGYLNMDRLAFDNWLLARADEKLNVTIMRRTMAKGLAYAEGHWTIELHDAEAQSIHAETVVLATGFHGTARLVPGFQPPRVEQYLALQAAVETDTVKDLIAVLSAEHTDYYGWIIPKDNVAHIGTGVPMPERKRGEEFIAEMARRFCGLSGEGLTLRGCPIAVPRSAGDIQVDVLPGAYAAGEAAGFVSPSSGDGISFALETGRIIGETIAKCRRDGPSDYNDTLDLIVRRLCPATQRMSKQIFKANIMARPWLRRVPERLLETSGGRWLARRLGVEGF